MISAVLRRTLVDLWDNAIVAFALNLALLCIVGSLLFAVSRASFLPPSLFVPMLLAGLLLLLWIMVFSATLLEQITARADIELRKAVPDFAFCALFVLAFAGVAGSAALMVQAKPVDPAAAVGMKIAGFWLSAVAAQMVLLAPAFALDRERTPAYRLGWLFMLVLRFPVSSLVFLVLSVFSLAATVGLLPGPAGGAYLFMHAGRLMRARHDPARQPIEADFETLEGLLAAETAPLRNRTPRNLLQPWRPSSSS